MSTMSVVLVAMLAAAVSPMAQAERLESKLFEKLRSLEQRIPRAVPEEKNDEKNKNQNTAVNERANERLKFYTGVIENCGRNNPDGLSLDQRVEWARDASDCIESADSTLQNAILDPQTDSVSLMALRSISGDVAALKDSAKLTTQTAEAEAEFAGLQWGIGIGISHGFHEAVDDAAVVNGVVRVNRDNSTRPRLILEFHRFFNHPDPAMGKSITHGNGPFVAVAAGEDDALSAVGAGWMWGWKDSTLPTDANAFTLGVGVVVDLNVKTLGDGIRANQPLPEGETEVRFKEKSRPSLMLVFTRTFN